MRQNRIPTSKDERLGPTVTREGRLGFTGSLLDKQRLGVFTAPYISQTGTSVKHAEEATTKQDDKTGMVTATIEEIAYYEERKVRICLLASFGVCWASRTNTTGSSSYSWLRNWPVANAIILCPNSERITV
jgi:hypothetical protein